MTEVHQFKSALDTFEYTNGVYNHTIAPGIWTYIDVDELNFEHLVDIVSKTHGIKIYVANQENFFKKFEIEIGANLGSIGSIGSIVSVEDSLASSSTTSALSANQGKLLNDAIGLKLDASSYNDYYKGTYTTLGNLQAATPTSTAGSYAIVDTGVGNDAKLYIWDTQDGWLEGGNTGAATTDALAEGLTNLYFTTARVRSSLLTGLVAGTNTPITSTNSLLIALANLQAQISNLTSTDNVAEGSTNLYFTTARVRSSLLTGLVAGTNTAILSSDTLLVALAKLQAQIPNLASYATTSSVATGLSANLEPTINTQPGLSYTVGTVGTDNNGKTILRMDNGADNTATITTAQTMPISIRQAGLGKTTLAAGAGVSLNGTPVFTAQHQTKTVIPLGSGIYDVVG